MPTSATTVTTNDQAVTITLPAGFIDGVGRAAAARLTVDPATAPETRELSGVRAIRIEVTRDDGTRVTQLSRPIDVVLRFTAADLARAGVAVSALQIQYSSEGLTWNLAATTVDADAGEARTSVDHLTTFALVGRRPPAPTATPLPPPGTATLPPSTWTATGTSTPTRTVTTTPSATAAIRLTPTNAPTWNPGLPSPTATFTPTRISTATVTMTVTPTLTDTPVPTDTPTAPRTATQTATLTPTATFTPLPATDPRRGVAIAGAGDAAAVGNVLSQTAAGAWFTYGMGTLAPAFGERIQMLRVGPHVLPSQSDPDIQSVARARPGSWWIVGNEPNVGDQDWDPSKDLAGNASAYATAYQRYRSVVLAADPTARFVVGNTLNFSVTCGGCVGYPLGRDFLDLFRAAYRSAYGSEPPVDAWGFHAYRLDWGQLPMVNTTEPINEIKALRQYLDAIPAQQGKPIWITELGVIWGYQDWCFVTDRTVTNAVTNDCRVGAGRTPTPRYPGQPAALFPFAEVDVNAYISTMVGWLTRNGLAYSVDRWFMFTDYGTPDRYTGVYAGIALMDGSGANAKATSQGRTYATAR